MNLQCGQHFPTFRPAYRDIYYNNRKTGGGAILDALPHLLNMGEWLAGPITHVTADADHLALPGVTVEDSVHVIARHGHTMASYSLNQHQYPNEPTLQLVCTKATVSVEAHKARISWTHKPGGVPDELRVEPIDRDTPFINQANHFIDVINDGKAPLCSLDEGMQTQRVINEVLTCADSPPWRLIKHAPVTSAAERSCGRWGL